MTFNQAVASQGASVIVMSNDSSFADMTGTIASTGSDDYLGVRVAFAGLSDLIGKGCVKFSPDELAFA